MCWRYFADFTCHWGGITLATVGGSLYFTTWSECTEQDLH